MIFADTYKKEKNMGEIRDYSCSCGYQKRIFAGAGLNGCDVNAIKLFFSRESVLFEQKRLAGGVKSYRLANTIVSCSHCKKIDSVPCFSYQTDSEIHSFYKKECSECGGPVIRIEDEEFVPCPECGLKMMYSKSGRWD